MNELTIIENNGILVIDSREVAEMLGKRHSDLLRDIEKYIETMKESQNAKLRSDNFFIESSYRSGTGKEYKCYLLTRKGCDMVANKTTGRDGIIFTAVYVEKFHDMESKLVQNYKLPATYKEALLGLVEKIEENEELTRQLEYKEELIVGFTEDIDVYKKQAILNRVVKHKGANFRDRWNELYRVFRETYHIDLKARKEGYNLKQTRAKDKYKSVLEYAVAFDFIEDLYKIALKLYESDMNEIIEQIRKVAWGDIMSWEEKLEICIRDIHIVENFEKYTFEILNKKYGFGIEKFKQLRTYYNKNRIDSLYQRKEELEAIIARRKVKITEEELKKYRREMIERLEKSGRSLKEVSKFLGGIEYSEITKILGRRYKPDLIYSDRELMWMAQAEIIGDKIVLTVAVDKVIPGLKEEMEERLNN